MRFWTSILTLIAIAPATLSAQEFHRGDPVPATMPLGNVPGNPTVDMMPGQRLISAFGERPALSPDGTKVAFIGKSYGDAYEYDLTTGRTRNLTSHAPSEGFLRVQYLPDGSYLLLGPHMLGKTREETRNNKIELFWMDAEALRPPVPLNTQVWEGVAISRRNNLIAWGQLNSIDGKPVSATIRTARVAVEKGTARLENVSEVFTTSDCLIEAQDFTPDDRALTMPCYNALGKLPAGTQADVVSLDLATKKLTRYPTPRGMYNEVEGIFPDGRRTLVECAQDRSAGMDLCILDLNPVAPLYTRMTNIVRYGRWKYGNPVVRPDGRMIAAQVGPADVVDAGVGQGIVLMNLAADF